MGIRFHEQDDITGSIPDEIPIEVDLGFLGLQKEYDNVHLPHKKTRGGELSAAQKQDNRALFVKMRLLELSVTTQSVLFIAIGLGILMTI